MAIVLVVAARTGRQETVGRDTFKSIGSDTCGFPVPPSGLKVV
jgi:hypothetical protein